MPLLRYQGVRAAPTSACPTSSPYGFFFVARRRMGVGGRGGAACVVMPVSKASPFPVGTDRRDRETTARLIQAQAPLLTASVPGLLAISAPTGFHEGRGLKYCHAVPVAAEPLWTASGR